MKVCKFLPTPAEIREQLPEQRPPGPSSEKALSELPAIPKKFFRLDDEEDRRQRLERLRATRKWDRYYS